MASPAGGTGGKGGMKGVRSKPPVGSPLSSSHVNMTATAATSAGTFAARVATPAPAVAPAVAATLPSTNASASAAAVASARVMASAGGVAAQVNAAAAAAAARTAGSSPVSASTSTSTATPASASRPASATTPSGGGCSVNASTSGVSGATVSASASKPGPTLKVSSQTRTNDVVITTLSGDYADRGLNHGRRYFQKMQKIAGHEEVSVFLYYWDARDGADFSGWWFGDQVGGSQVWARASVHNPLPPKVGWRIPWDATSIESGALVVEQLGNSKPAGVTSLAGLAAAKKSSSDDTATEATPATPASTPHTVPGGSSPAALLRKAAEQVSAMETAANAALSSARKLTATPTAAAAAASPVAPPSMEVIRDVMDMLEKHNSKLTDIQNSLTHDVNESRKNGVSATSVVTELSKLSPKVKSLQTMLATELNKLKGVLLKTQTAKQIAEFDKKREEAGREARLLEEQDAQAFQEMLPKAKESTAEVETVVEAVSALAGPLILDPPEEGEAKDNALCRVELVATDAHKKLTEARNDLNSRITHARKYAPETRKVALMELSVLQGRLAEAQKMLNPYRNFKKEFAGRVQAKKAILEVAEKLNVAEVEVEKAEAMVRDTEDVQMADDEVTALEQIVGPANSVLTGTMQVIVQRSRSVPDGAFRDELEQLKARGMDVRKKLEGIGVKVRGQREGLAAQQALVVAREKTERSEQALVKCQEAELPFLKGLEVLPRDQADKAISDSELAASEAVVMISQAKMFLRAKLAESKRYVKDLSESVTDQLTPFLTRVEASEAQLATFRKEIGERKLASLLAEAVEGVAAAEKKVDQFEDVAKLFQSDTFEESSTQELKDALERSGEAEKEAALACNEARRVILAKQKEAPKTTDAGASLAKIQVRLNQAQERLGKQRLSMASGDKLIKVKVVIEQEEEKLATAESEVDGMEDASVAPAGMSDVAVRTMDETMNGVQKVLKSMQATVQPFLATAPAKSKEALQNLLQKRIGIQEKIDQVKVATKEQRERVLSEFYLKEAERKTDDVEASIEKMNDAELPFLKGIEVLPLEEAKETILASERAAADVQDVMSQARTYIASRNLEVRSFGQEVSKIVQDGLARLTERINVAAQKLGAFRKDTDARKRAALVQEGAERVDQVEELVRKLVEAAEPFTQETAAGVSEEELAGPLEAFLELEKEVVTKMTTTRAFLAERQRFSKDHAEQQETVKRLQARLLELQTETSRAKKSTSDHELRFVAKRMLAETAEQVATIDADVKRATDFCAPFLEDGGEEYLIGTSIRTLANALSEYMKEKDIDEEALFKEAGGGQNMSENAFVAYLEGLPEEIKHEEVNFTEERRLAIFRRLVSSTDTDGEISLEDFGNIFRQRCVCVKSIAVTDGFVVSESKTVAKIDPGEMMEAFGAPRADEAGMLRTQVRLVASDKTGWLTAKGNQGTVFVEAISPFNTFCGDMDRCVAECTANINKVSTFLNMRLKETGGGSTTVAKGEDGAPMGPMTEARIEMTKFRPRVTTALASLEALRKKVNAAKLEFRQREKAEINAHIDARERKEAEIITIVVQPKVAAAEASATAIEDVGTALLELEETSALLAFEKPAEVQEELDKLATMATTSITEARVALREQLLVASKVQPVTRAVAEAKRELQKMVQKVEVAQKNIKRVADGVKARCNTIVDLRFMTASAALRAQARGRQMSAEAMFEEFSAKDEGDEISEAAFCEKLMAVEGLELLPDHAKLICRYLQNGTQALGRRRFLTFLQLYYVVVKDTALTDVFDVNTCKILRKAQVDEIVEVIEGPIADERLGVTRIQGKSLCDGAIGWISIQGNQGTPFLHEVEKPCFTCLTEVNLEKEFKSEGKEVTRTLEEDEILELIEGPRKEVLPDTMRARVKVIPDSSTGWVTVKDRTGLAFAEPNPKLFVCVASVAMTDGGDIRQSKVVRKLAVGELFEVVGDITEDPVTGIERVQGVALKDGRECWITTKGNAGTVYAEAKPNYYSVLREVELQKRFASEDAEVIRTLAPREVFLALEGPKEETTSPEVRAKVVALRDGAVGWISVKESSVKNWTPMYKCIVSTPMHDRLASEGATVLRDVSLGETIELLEGPVRENNETRMRGRAAKLGTTGWITIRDAEGKRYLES
eukprot:TRINITY_DN27151_c0_g1_i1.p1 TRINITY_DN27151_c0_g1~~TRINITY_DN27151_c0_g1_i1.p1  ORF type:complete len:2139 (+),score=568.46 TRINITY_DN27151_c0_g1_i1:1-6417(+)